MKAGSGRAGAARREEDDAEYEITTVEQVEEREKAERGGGGDGGGGGGGGWDDAGVMEIDASTPQAKKKKKRRGGAGDGEAVDSDDVFNFKESDKESDKDSDSDIVDVPIAKRQKPKSDGGTPCGNRDGGGAQPQKRRDISRCHGGAEAQAEAEVVRVAETPPPPERVREDRCRDGETAGRQNHDAEVERKKKRGKGRVAASEPAARSHPRGAVLPGSGGGGDGFPDVLEVAEAVGQGSRPGQDDAIDLDSTGGGVILPLDDPLEPLHMDLTRGNGGSHGAQHSDIVINPEVLSG